MKCLFNLGISIHVELILLRYTHVYIRLIP